MKESNWEKKQKNISLKTMSAMNVTDNQKIFDITARNALTMIYVKNAMNKTNFRASTSTNLIK